MRVVLALSVLLLTGLTGCRSTPAQPPSGVRPDSTDSAIPVRAVGGVNAPTLDPGGDPGEIRGSLPHRDGLKLTRSAVVEIRDQDGRLVAQARTNVNGDFQVNVPPGDYFVNAVPPGYHHPISVPLHVGAGQVNQVDLKPPAN